MKIKFSSQRVPFINSRDSEYSYYTSQQTLVHCIWLTMKSQAVRTFNNDLLIFLREKKTYVYYVI